MVIKKIIRPAISLFIFLSIITGIIYPLVVTSIGQIFFSKSVNGNLIKINNTVVGSKLVGQFFTSPEYFWGRPSATIPFAYNPIGSTGSNLSVFNPELIQIINTRIELLKKADPENQSPIPVDLVTASASGLDPDLSLAATIYQIDRVARARGLSAEKVRQLVDANIQGRQLGILGEPRVNILKLNIELDQPH